MGILEAVQAKLRDLDKEALERVADGSGVPYNTLLKIQNGATADPRVRTVEKLVEHFDRQAA